MKTYEDIAKVFKALSDPNRLRILMLLEEKSLCVCEITDILGLATSTVSNHLSILHEAGLIQQERSGKWVNYFLRTNVDNVQTLLNELTKLLKTCHDAKADIAKAKTVDRLKIRGH